MFLVCPADVDCTTEVAVNVARMRRRFSRAFERFFRENIVPPPIQIEMKEYFFLHGQYQFINSLFHVVRETNEFSRQSSILDLSFLFRIDIIVYTWYFDILNGCRSQTSISLTETLWLSSIFNRNDVHRPQLLQIRNRC